MHSSELRNVSLLGVARIPHYKDLNVRRGNSIKSFALLSKDLTIDVQQGSTFHSRASRAHSTSWNTSYGSVPISTSRNKGNKESSSSIATPSRAWIDLSDPRSFKAMGWSGPNTEPEASYTR
ncbi:hypothetical protein HID58_046005 [Brassica napus]|uniref:Uncharacterized protein n=1 Tax=Brassica napus TaxID=3708 RepID=A0ABQ8AVT5_BRANA|nr:hypothetical protein HID58_046005 [Brassica napus]